MINQISLFDLLPQEEVEYPDWHDMSEEQIARFIGEQLGLMFTPNNKYRDAKGYLAYRDKTGEFEIGIGHYAVDLDKDGQPFVRKGQAFISAHYWNKKLLGGSGGSCDSLEEAVNHLRAAEKQAEKDLAYREELKVQTKLAEEPEEDCEEDMVI